MAWTEADLASTAAGKRYFSQQGTLLPSTTVPQPVASMSMYAPAGSRQLVLPWPPSINHYYVMVGKSLVISAAGRAYRQAVAAAVLDQWRQQQAMVGALSVMLDYHPPDRRRRDIDNPLKALLDALTHGGAWGDDSQVREMHLFWREHATPGYVAVTIGSLL